MAENSIWMFIRSVVLIIISLYIIMVIALVIFQSRLIYMPHREIVITPAQIGLAYEEIYLKSSDETELSAWFIPAENSRAVILFCHGNAGNISHRLESIQLFNHLGLSVFIFDYRGYGLSDGKPSEQGTYLDSEAAWQYLVEIKQIDPSEIIIFGRSLGGSVAARLASHYMPLALIVESSFTSINDIGAKIYPIFPIKLISRFDYNTIDYIQNSKCPVLIVHSRDDEMMPFDHGQRLYKSAKEPKEFLEISGTHNDGFLTSGKLYRDGIDSFISKNLMETQ